MKLNELSIFFPLYNEQENVVRLVNSAILVAKKVSKKYEIILVNDGSTDNTLSLCNKLALENNNIFVVSQENKGYGGALITGINSCNFEWIFFSDGDLQFNLEELEKFVEYTNDYDFIIGFRKNRSEGFKRYLIAKLLKIWNYIFLGFPLEIKDIDCAFKLLNKHKLKSLGGLKSTGPMISTEMLIKAHKKNFRIKQIGVSHFKRISGKSTGSNINVILKGIKETFELRKLLTYIV